MHEIKFDDIVSVLIWVIIIINIIASFLKKDKKKKTDFVDYSDNFEEEFENENQQEEEKSLWDKENFEQQEITDLPKVEKIPTLVSSNNENYNYSFNSDSESKKNVYARNIKSFIADKNNLKKAIILSEILNKPKALRRNG